MAKSTIFGPKSVGVIVHGLDDAERKAAHAADITYGTNNEFGFDYLRDNMKFYKEQLAQRGHFYAIVDEVDSFLLTKPELHWLFLAQVKTPPPCTVVLTPLCQT